MKVDLNKMVNETSIADSRGNISLICAVLLKYGIAPVVMAYCFWAMTKKDEVIQKNNDTVVTIVREQTTATSQNTIALQGLNTVIQSYNTKLDKIEDERKTDRRGF